MDRSLPRRPKARFLHRFPILLILLAASLLAASASAAAGRTAETPAGLERQIREWTAALSAHQPFEEWKHAVPDIQALGPGTHGWLAILNSAGRPVGYMVVYASEDGTFRLGEYGAGPNVLFSPAALDKSLSENGLLDPKKTPYKAIRHYFHPFAAVWEVSAGQESYWIDAKTGELLPFERESWDRLLPSLQQSVPPDSYGFAAKTDSSFLGDTFDAYEKLPWLTGEKPFGAENAEKVQSRIRSGLHLRYVTEPYGEAALYALPVTGYQKWENGRLDLALDMAGSRFIPIRQLQQYGKFYE
jgi:hypothetical protein